MAFEIDYLAVGEGEKSGDAIALRFWDNINPQKVVVIDGGTKDSGEALVNHINQYYGTKSVDAVICTHPDSDHASGLTVILEKMEVKNLLIHRPWEHADSIKNMFASGKITRTGLESKLEDALKYAKELEEIATKKRIPIYEPFAGVKGFNNIMHVLGPTEEYYKELVCNFDCLPTPKPAFTLPEQVKKIAEEAVEWIADQMHINHLDDIDRTSHQNNSSAIILFNFDGHKILFTGDAGITALDKAADYASGLGISLTDLRFLDVPHHGSKRNAGATVYNKIKASTAFISAAKDGSPKHPAKKVTNALRKNGSEVYVTRGVGLCHSEPTAVRAGWYAATQEPFHNLVEK